MFEPDEPQHDSWNLGTPDNAVGTEVIVNPYADRPKRTAKVSLKAQAKKRSARVMGKAKEAMDDALHQYIDPEGYRHKKSISIAADGGREKLISLIHPDGSEMTPEDAIKRYHKTGEHLGEFDTPEEATAHAQKMMNKGK